VPGAALPELLAAWRTAERRWERPGTPDDVRAAALEVVAAWVAYQDAALAPAGGEFMLVADERGVLVAATSGIAPALGHEPSEVIGRTIVEIAAPELRDTTPGQWDRFLAEGRQDGRYRLRGSDGRLVWLRYQARAHHPVPGFHLSRLWPDDSPG
jgi:PAS domain S-box-containing protein